MSTLVTRNVAEAVAAEHGVDVDAILGRSMLKPICRARMEVYRRLRARGWSVGRIGMWMHRDHTTICYALRRLQNEASAEV